MTQLTREWAWAAPSIIISLSMAVWTLYDSRRWWVEVNKLSADYAKLTAGVAGFKDAKLREIDALKAEIETPKSEAERDERLEGPAAI